MVRKNRGRLLCAIPMICSLVASGFAQTPAPDQATAQKLMDMLRDRDTAIRAIARTTNGPLATADREKLRGIVGDTFDYEELSRQSLGKYWAERTPAERKEFVGLYRQLIEKSYADPKLYRKVEKIAYDGAEVTGGTATVRTTVQYKGEKSAIKYALLRSGDKWLIGDMVIDDVSVVRNNRQNFYREVAKSGYAGLVAKIRKKLTEEPSRADKPSGSTF